MITALEQAVSYLIDLADFDQPLDLRLTYIPDGLLSIQPYKEPEEKEDSTPSGTHQPSSMAPGHLPQEVKMIYLSNSSVKQASAVFNPDGSVLLLPGSYINTTPNTTAYKRERETKFYGKIEKHIKSLIDEGKIKQVYGELILAEPLSFYPQKANSSALTPSAEFLMRGPINGWDAWTNGNGDKLPREKVDEEPEVEEDETAPTPPSPDSKHESKKKDEAKTKAKAAKSAKLKKPQKQAVKYLSIVFPSGKKIKGTTTKDTFVKFVEQIGPDDIEALKIEHLGALLIQREPFEKEYVRKQQALLSNGAYLNSFGDTPRIANLVNEIAQKLGISVRTEIEVKE